MIRYYHDTKNALIETNCVYSECSNSPRGCGGYWKESPYSWSLIDDSPAFWSSSSESWGLQEYVWNKNVVASAIRGMSTHVWYMRVHHHAVL